jgi:hypothetical protein
MDKEMLDIVNDLSKKPTTELALQIMELSSENLILEQQNKKQKETIDKAINDLNIILEIVREQPSGSDCWIINRLEANKKMLKEVSE